jgi:hypothetical protein
MTIDPKNRLRRKTGVAIFLMQRWELLAIALPWGWGGIPLIHEM